MSGKLLRPRNWLRLDPAFEKSSGFTIDECLAQAQSLMNLGPGNWNYSGPIRASLTADDWIEKVTRHRLHLSVPEDIRVLFSGAQAALSYGCYFYTLCTLAMEQLLRVLEASITKKCEEYAGPEQKEAFHKKLKWLLDNGKITQEQWHGWDRLRTIRNSTSHPQHQMLMPPAMCDHTFELLTKEINDLFSPMQSKGPESDSS